MSHEAALQADAGEYAEQLNVTTAEALRRLEAQQASVPATDAIAREFADRLAGISIEHSPQFRIVVLLTAMARWRLARPPVCRSSSKPAPK